ncbi:PKD domain-containing protein [Thiothrix winogradskyi]|uniref:PKD domain-containing protein n=1 Tax=Thiothrix winogradskyi TaxID=96472 RepID=A0ABY3T4V6_9GAMM|nr:PKD domain-containing protein [Thiothrix winogradskyi]UJS26264.1 PKD domain-containing protein [Thiothrix winogradskyi]
MKFGRGCVGSSPARKVLSPGMPLNLLFDESTRVLTLSLDGLPALKAEIPDLGGGGAGKDGKDGINGKDGKDGVNGTNGTNGVNGTNGTNGVDGKDGQGVPTGGAIGQVLVKTGAADFATGWQDAPSGSGDFDPNDNADLNNLFARIAAHPNAVVVSDLAGNPIGYLIPATGAPTTPTFTALPAIAAPSAMLASATAALTAAGGATSDGNPVTYLWTYPQVNGSMTTSTNNPLNWTAPSTPGTYTVSLQAVASDGVTKSTVVTHDIVVSAAVITFTSPPTISGADNIVAGTTGNYSGAGAAASDGNPVTYEWILPDGSTSTTNPLAYTAPTTPGDYTLTVRAVASDGTKSAPVTKTITVDAVTFTAQPTINGDTTATVNGTVVLTASGGVASDGNPVTYEWTH